MLASDSDSLSNLVALLTYISTDANKRNQEKEMAHECTALIDLTPSPSEAEVNMQPFCFAM